MLRTTLRIVSAFLMLFAAAESRADDRDAFAARPVPPNIMWLLDNSGSMDNLPCSEFTDVRCFYDAADRYVVNEINTDITLGAVGASVGLCRSRFFDSLHYDHTITYPRPDPDFDGHSGAFPDLYPTAKIYQHDNWGGPAADADTYCNGISNCAQKERCKYAFKKYGYYYEPNGCGASGDPSGTCGVVPSACTSLPLTDVGGSCLLGTTCDCGICSGGKCQECSSNADCGTGATCQASGGVNRCKAGNTSNVSTARMNGNFLRMYPPKYVGGRRAVKDVLQAADTDANLARQRVGLFAYNGNNGGDGGSVIKRMGPSCNNMCTTSGCDAAFKASRDAIVASINAMSFNTNTPLGESLDDIGCYFANGNPPRACAYRQDQVVATDNTSTPMCLNCQTNFAILITDGLPTSDTSAGLSQASGAGDPEGYILPNVASYVFHNDLDTATPGVQNIITYTVSFGKTDPLDNNKCAGVLERAALAGNGKCFPARDRQQLKDALSSIITEIAQRAHSFTAPAIQTTRSQNERNANLAVFKPLGTGPMWEGHIYSFALFDETVEGTQFTGGNSSDPNEVFVLDANNNPVSFDSEGNLLSKPFWDAGLCLAGDVYGNRGSFTPEDPFNIDVSACTRAANETAGNARRIYTKIDPTTGTGGSVPDPFTVANVTALAPKIGAALPFSATKIIQYFRGFDMLDIAGIGTVGPGTATINGVTYTTPIERSLSTLGQKKGWWKLGDIYHSAPTVVVAPQEYLGVFGSFSGFFSANKGRKRLLLAGANDGMIHGFDAGDPTGNEAPVLYTQGNGEELWSFVPPDQLPKMGAALSCTNDATTACGIVNPYTYYVDGSPQVRDIYTGTGSARGTDAEIDNAANGDKWKSIVVIGDRDGGNRFTALDVTDPANPLFLWQFPTANHLGAGANLRNEAAGLSWSEILPNPAPILPVLFDADGSAATTSDIYKRWVVLLPGGFSRNQVGGRGVYMVDANNGQLLWKFEYGTSDPEHQAMRYSFAAPPSAAIWPPDFGARAFTTAIAVDTGGQVWQFDFSQPGTLTTGLAQFPGKRIFQTAAATSTSAAYAALPDNNGLVTTAEYPYRPFFGMAALAVSRDQHSLLAYVGTGDRDLLGNPPLAHSLGITLDATVPDVVCGRAPYNSLNYTNRLYMLNVSALSLLGSAGNESNLYGLNGSATPGEVQALYDPANNPAAAGKIGWFLSLRPGEKVNNPADVFNKVVYYTSYQPTGVCSSSGSTVDTCDAPSGVGRLYALDFETGRPAIDFGGSGGTNFGTVAGVTTTSVDTSKSLGAGIPTVSSVSVGLGNGKQSAAMLMATSNDPTPQATKAPGPSSLVKRVLSTFVPEELHSALQSLGSDH